MAVILKHDSGIGAGSTLSDGFVERRYLIGATSDNDAYTQLLAHADCPDYIEAPFGNLYRQAGRLAHIGGGNYEAEFRWAGSDSDFVDVSFSTTGKTEHITQSLNTKKYPASGVDEAPGHFSQIGVTEDGVEGVDVVVPAFSWTETHTKASSFCDAAYRDVLKSLTGSVNNGTFRSHAAGEVLFLGCTGSKKNAFQWQLEFSFTAISNATLSVGGITGIDKLGHEYMWTRYQKVEDALGKFIVSAPIGVYVERVYPSADFSSLGIGTGDV